MVNRGAVSQSLPINGSYTIPQGYHNGSGKVTQSITTQGATTYVPTKKDLTINSGVYLTGNQTIKGEPNLIPDNILEGKSIFGVNGTVPVSKYRVYKYSSVGANGLVRVSIDKGDIRYIDVLLNGNQTADTINLYGFDISVDFSPCNLRPLKWSNCEVRPSVSSSAKKNYPSLDVCNIKLSIYHPTGEKWFTKNPPSVINITDYGNNNVNVLTNDKVEFNINSSLNFKTYNNAEYITAYIHDAGKVTSSKATKYSLSSSPNGGTYPPVFPVDDLSGNQEITLEAVDIIGNAGYVPHIGTLGNLVVDLEVLYLADE